MVPLSPDTLQHQPTRAEDAEPERDEEHDLETEPTQVSRRPGTVSPGANAPDETRKQSSPARQGPWPNLETLKQPPRHAIPQTRTCRSKRDHQSRPRTCCPGTRAGNHRPTQGRLPLTPTRTEAISTSARSSSSAILPTLDARDGTAVPTQASILRHPRGTSGGPTPAGCLPSWRLRRASRRGSGGRPRRAGHARAPPIGVDRGPAGKSRSTTGTSRRQ